MACFQSVKENIWQEIKPQSICLPPYSKLRTAVPVSASSKQECGSLSATWEIRDLTFDLKESTVRCVEERRHLGCWGTSRLFARMFLKLQL